MLIRVDDLAHPAVHALLGEHLADAIINADNSLIRSLKRDDLELLLS